MKITKKVLVEDFKYYIIEDKEYMVPGSLFDPNQILLDVEVNNDYKIQTTACKAIYVRILGETNYKETPAYIHSIQENSLEQTTKTEVSLRIMCEVYLHS